MRSIGGLPFALESALPLSSEERRFLQALERIDVEPFVREPFVLTLTATEPWSPSTVPLPNEPATLSFDGDRIRVAHAEGIGEIDLAARRGTYARTGESAAPLRAMLRTAVVSMLPSHGGIPLHAAGLVAGDEAIVLFGESGAGKSTIAAISQLPVLSDEIVAVNLDSGRPFARSTGFGDELHAERPVGDAKPVAAFVQLAKADRFEVTPLAREEALRALLKVILSPPHPLVWSHAIATVGALLATRTPIVRMGWRGTHSPIPELRAALSLRAHSPALRR